MEDYHGVGNTRPVLDGRQDYHLLSLKENETSTVMTICRQFRTHDPNDLDITDDTMRVIFAYGTDDTIHYHMRFRGTKSIYLLQEDQPSGLPSPGNFTTKELRIGNFSIRATETIYACTFAILPSVETKHHIYKFEPIIQAGNEALVHHIVLYTCPGPGTLVAPMGECQNRTQSHPFSQCVQVLAAWAVGGEAFQFPSHVGISLGTPDDPTLIMMEIHYSNFQAAPGLWDNSGMRLYYTPEVREHDVGVLEVGPTLSASLFIPPRLESFKAYGLCKTDKFKMLSPDAEEMQVFASLLHTHLTGRAMQIAHFRNGTQIGFLGRDMNYDFNLQETRLLRDVATLKVGDEIVVECTYNTKDRSNLTYGGTGTRNEMCMGFLYLYPRNSISNCVSHPDLRSIALALGRNVSSIQEAVMVIRSFEWDDASARMIEDMSRDTMHTVYLMSRSRALITDSGYVCNITEPTRGPSADLPAPGMHDFVTPDSGRPGGHLPNMATRGSRASPAWLLPLVLLFFHAGLV